MKYTEIGSHAGEIAEWNAEIRGNARRFILPPCMSLERRGEKKETRKDAEITLGLRHHTQGDYVVCCIVH
jgi:hypothetical protein